MYNSIKSCIVYNDNKSDFFSSEVGFRQSENVYTFLFAVFLNDLEQFMEDNNIRSTIGNIFKIGRPFKYADDTCSNVRDF